MSSWKDFEDVTLCECWYHATHDPTRLVLKSYQKSIHKIVRSANDT